MKGLDKNLLNCLQDFFEVLDEEEFYRMDEAYFMKKADELGFKARFSRR